MITKFALYSFGFFILVFLVFLVVRKNKKLSHLERILDSWDRIGDQLREEHFHVWPRLNEDKTCVEFRRSKGSLFARVSVHGGEGFPMFATVVSPKPLPEIARLAFEQELSALVAVDFKIGI
ncbi:MAG: hypothetical protein PHD04_02810 [Candidatus Pacebacteria bacterium]|nr:hypothetical protein [Candidatus Paceibacterota bacterium]